MASYHQCHPPSLVMGRTRAGIIATAKGVAAVSCSSPIIKAAPLIQFVGNDPTQTPSSHRQRLATELGPSTGIASLHQNGRTASAPISEKRSASIPSPLTSMSPNGNNRYSFAGYGMSAGMKVSQPPMVAQGVSGGSRSTFRSRGSFSYGRFLPCQY